MALPILDGNQSATTLSTILDGGQHIPAHTVVSLGSQAISNITSAVSGSVVSVSNFPATQTIAGTVTALLNSEYITGNVTYARVDIYSQASGEEPSPVNTSNPLPISGTVTAHLADSNQNLIPLDFSAIDNDGVPNRGVQIGWADTQQGSFYQVSDVNPLPVSGTVTANLSKPTWTDYSGTVVTAGSAVTAISTTARNYLLAQVTTGQMFLNIGATATTGNSVYFSAGQGFAWETSVPQGIVSIISSVTGTNYVLKDG